MKTAVERRVPDWSSIGLNPFNEAISHPDQTRQSRAWGLSMSKDGHKAWDTVRLPVSGAIFNHDVFSFNITEISQSSAKTLNVRPQRRVRANESHVAYPWDFLRLLRFDRSAKRKEHSAKGKTETALAHY